MALFGKRGAKEAALDVEAVDLAVGSANKSKVAARCQPRGLQRAAELHRRHGRGHTRKPGQAFGRDSGTGDRLCLSRWCQRLCAVQDLVLKTPNTRARLAQMHRYNVVPVALAGCVEKKRLKKEDNGKKKEGALLCWAEKSMICDNFIWSTFTEAVAAFFAMDPCDNSADCSSDQVEKYLVKESNTPE